MLLSAVSAPLTNPPLTSLQLCQICSSEVVCATFWARESRPASPASDSVCPPAERLWPTDGHVTTLLSLQWEAGGWWTGDGVTLDGPWSLCPRVPSPSALRDLLLLLESMIRFTLGCKPSILTQICKSPACFMLYWIETLEKQKILRNDFDQNIVKLSSRSVLLELATQYTSYSFVYSIVVFLWYILVPCLTML